MKAYFRVSQRPKSGDAPRTYEESLLLDLQLAKWELENAYAGFDYATDPDMIDYYIYTVNAAMKRYKYVFGKYTALQKSPLRPEDAKTDIPPLPEGTLQLLT